MKECSFLDNDHKREWADISALCTSKWMSILISHRTSRFNKLKQDVLTLIQDITSHNMTIPLSWLDTVKKNTKTDEDSLLRMKLGKFRRDLDDYNNDRVFSWNKKWKTHSHYESPVIPGQRDVLPPSHASTDSPSRPLIQIDPPRPLMSLSVGPPTWHHNWKPNRAPCHPDPSAQVKKQSNNKNKRNTHRNNLSTNASLLSALNQFYNRQPTTPSLALLCPMIPLLLLSTYSHCHLPLSIPL